MPFDELEMTPEVLPVARSREPASAPSFGRASTDGKFLSVGNESLFVRGVTYGAFQPDERGREYTDDRLIERDFAQMARLGINTVRIPHTVPPRSLLDAAKGHGCGSWSASPPSKVRAI